MQFRGIIFKIKGNETADEHRFFDFKFQISNSKLRFSNLCPAAIICNFIFVNL